MKIGRKDGPLNRPVFWYTKPTMPNHQPVVVPVIPPVQPATQPTVAPSQPVVAPALPTLAPGAAPAKRTFPKILSTGFLVAASTALSLYIHSSFLKTIVPEAVVGYLFTLAYALTFFAIQNYWRLIARFGNQKVLLGIITLQMAAAILLASPIHDLISIAAFVVFVMTMTMNIINFDLWLEPLTNNEETGRVRGMFWTAVSLGFVVSPLLTGTLVSRFGFGAAFLSSAVVMIPAWVIIFSSLRDKQGVTQYRKHEPSGAMLGRIITNHDLRGVFVISLMLYAFYAWMVVYTPIYLVNAGLNWQEIGLLFMIMLIPFVIIDYPAGWLADKYLGETEMLTLGFAIMGVSVLLMLKADTFMEFALTLFFSRVGASLVEMMRETYFYKKVDAHDLDLIDAYRNTATVGNIIAPLIASFFLLSGVELSDLMVGLGVAMILCTGIPITMVDTK